MRRSLLAKASALWCCQRYCSDPLIALCWQVRVRPLNARESENDIECADCPDAETVEVPDLVGLRPLHTNRSFQVETDLVNKSWRFDRCFGPETSQEDFFEDCGAIELIQAALDG
jgi:hypothetical protein